MREILFRGKRTDNGEWVYGCYFKHDLVKVCFSSDDPKTNHMIVKDGACDWGFEPEMRAYDVIPESVSEYTGMKDKNGKRIFEGDIIRVKFESGNLKGFAFSNMPVGFQRGAFCLSEGNGCVFCVLGAIEPSMSLEIIGNVHDHPELIDVVNQNVDQ